MNKLGIAISTVILKDSGLEIDSISWDLYMESWG